MSLSPSSSRGSSGWPSQWTADANGNTTFAPTEALHNGWFVFQAPTGSKTNETDAFYLKDEDGNTVLLIACEGGIQTAETATSTDGIRHRLSSNATNGGFRIHTGNDTPFRVATDGTIGFFTTVPAAQPAAISNAAGGVVIDAEARTALNSLLAAMRTLGLITT